MNFRTGKVSFEITSVSHPSPLAPLLIVFSPLCIILVTPQSQLSGGGFFVVFFSWQNPFFVRGMLPVAKFSLRCLCLPCTGSVGIV